MSQSQASQLFEGQIEKYAHEGVLYMLMQHVKNTTIKKPDLMKTVAPEQSRRINIKSIQNSMKQILRKTYGLEAVEIDETIKQYILINKLQFVEEAVPAWDEDIIRKQALLVLTLGLIFMNGGQATENELWSLFRKLSVISSLDTSLSSDRFGDVDSILKKEFVQQRYLVYAPERQSNSQDGESQFQFTWGIRAELEVTKERVLKFVSEIFDVDMTHWTEQYTQIRN